MLSLTVSLDAEHQNHLASAYDKCPSFRLIIDELRKEIPGRHVDRFSITKEGWLMYSPPDNSGNQDAPWDFSPDCFWYGMGKDFEE